MERRGVGLQEEERRRPRRPAASEIVTSTLQVGALSGVCGAILGCVAGLVRSSRPVLFAAATGMQWTALGTTYWATRSLILNAYEYAPLERSHASSLAGAFTGGSVGGLIRGRSNVLPGALMFGIFGYLGQKSYDTLDAMHTVEVEQQARTDSKPAISFWRRVAAMRWSPMKILSDEEYEGILKEKLLRVDAELAILDEDIAKLRAQGRAIGKSDVDGKT